MPGIARAWRPQTDLNRYDAMNNGAQTLRAVSCKGDVGGSSATHPHSDSVSLGVE